MCACRAACGYCGATWRTSRPCATPEETFCGPADAGGGAVAAGGGALAGGWRAAVVVGCGAAAPGGRSVVVDTATGMFLTIFSAPFGATTGGAASSFLAVAVLLGAAAGGVKAVLLLPCLGAVILASILANEFWSCGLP